MLQGVPPLWAPSWVLRWVHSLHFLWWCWYWVGFTVHLFFGTGDTDLSLATSSARGALLTNVEVLTTRDWGRWFTWRMQCQFHQQIFQSGYFVFFGVGLKALTNTSFVTHVSLPQALKAAVRVTVRHCLTTRVTGLKIWSMWHSLSSEPIPRLDARST